MGRIHVLDEVTANGIAAGEVVERPSSVVKELIENAMDAGAQKIVVEIEGGGISLIRVTDDGCGMDEEDARMAFQIHATSKLESLSDLYSLSSMGFRGEALASIAAVSRVRLRTCRHGDDSGTQVDIEAGRFANMSRFGGPPGTRIEIRDLFFNMPARYKFLKKDQTEAQYITNLVERFALIRPDISFRYINNGKEILHTPGNNDKMSALYSIYGRNIVSACIPMTVEGKDITVEGFVGKPEIARASRSEQTIFVNDRLIRSKTVASAIDEAYKTVLMKGKYAFVILSLYISPSLVDVNVHPQKSEVRFWSDGDVFRAVFHAVQNTLLSTSHEIQLQGESVLKPIQEPANRQDSGEDKSVSVDQPHANIPVYAEAFKNEKSDQRRNGSYQTYAPSTTESSFQTQLRLTGDELLPEMSQTIETKPNTVIVSETIDDNRIYRDKYGFSVKDLLQSRIIGSVFSTYILLEHMTDMILIDQHAAHEKILFEELMQKHDENKDKPSVCQPLLVPELIRLSATEGAILEQNADHIANLGFSYAYIGEREIVLREVPVLSLAYTPEVAFRNVLDISSQEKETTDEAFLLRLATAACKAAVKGHDRLSEQEIHGLLQRLSQLKNPYHCPHGRPIMIRLSQKELEKEFKRIV